MDQADAYILKNGGIDSEKDYPYVGANDPCSNRTARHVAFLTGHTDVAPNSTAALLAAVAKGPVSVAIEADQAAFQGYAGGVFDAPCGTKLDHGVLVVGYGTDAGKDYWTVKNSWGAQWGEQGYIRMARGGGADAGAGLCGILSIPTYPLVPKGPAPPVPPPSPGPPPGPKLKCGCSLHATQECAQFGMQCVCEDKAADVTCSPPISGCSAGPAKCNGPPAGQGRRPRSVSFLDADHVARGVKPWK